MVAGESARDQGETLPITCLAGGTPAGGGQSEILLLVVRPRDLCSEVPTCEDYLHMKSS